jgi:hypothetical protein
MRRRHSSHNLQHPQRTPWRRFSPPRMLTDLVLLSTNTNPYRGGAKDQWASPVTKLSRNTGCSPAPRRSMISAIEFAIVKVPGARDGQGWSCSGCAKMAVSLAWCNRISKIEAFLMRVNELGRGFSHHIRHKIALNRRMRNLITVEQLQMSLPILGI